MYTVWFVDARSIHAACLTMDIITVSKRYGLSAVLQIETYCGVVDGSVVETGGGWGLKSRTRVFLDICVYVHNTNCITYT